MDSYYGKLKADVREIIKKLCDYSNYRKRRRSTVCVDYVYLCVSIPPSEKDCDVVVYIKGKSALMLYDKNPEIAKGWSKSLG